MIREVGKSKAMEMILTGETIDAKEAHRIGLVKDVYSPETLIDEAILLASKISWYSMPALSLAKQSINAAYESNL